MFDQPAATGQTSWPRAERIAQPTPTRPRLGEAPQSAMLPLWAKGRASSNVGASTGSAACRRARRTSRPVRNARPSRTTRSACSGIPPASSTVSTSQVSARRSHSRRRFWGCSMTTQILGVLGMVQPRKGRQCSPPRPARATTTTTRVRQLWQPRGQGGRTAQFASRLPPSPGSWHVFRNHCVCACWQVAGGGRHGWLQPKAIY